jgi:(p)ppGpp synthase/HD superfamily hydrolase
LQAHAGQVDKAGEAYILHPMRVMQQMSSDEERIVAVLHDVVEDSSWTLADLQNEGFSEEVLDALDKLTKREGEEYMAFVKRAKDNPIARAVKIADTRDNMDLSRIGEPIEEDRRRIEEKYKPGLAVLVQ